MRNPPKAELYMVGSDQVWNPDITKDFAEIYFLNFGSDKTPRVSYASSFGKEMWEHPLLKESVNKHLSRFICVSCREESGVALLKKEFGIDAEVVVDPTLLLHDYSELIGETKERETLVYYPLSHDEELESCSIALACRLGLTPINDREETMLFGKIPWRRTSIQDWVRNIAEAQFVITRSFHGLVFCLIYKRQFAILASRNGRGGRLLNLLNMVGLQDRFYLDAEALERDEPWNKAIDYSAVDIILRDRRNESLKYLNEALNNI